MLLVLDPDAEFHDRAAALVADAGLRSVPLRATDRAELEAVVADGTPLGAVVIGPGVDLALATSVSAWLQGVAPETVTLLVALPTTATLRAALRSGARDVLAPSCSPAEFGEALRAAGYDERSVDHGRPGLTVAVFSAKGGVGTSVLASNLAVRLAAHTGVDCILADLDLPSADQAVLHGVRPSWTVQEIADGVVGDDVDAVEQVLLPVNGTGVQLLAGPADPAAAESITDGAVLDVLHRLRQLAPLVVVDTSSTFSDVTLAVLEQADVIVLVVSLDVLSLRSLTVTLQTFDRLGIPRDRLRVAVMRAGAKVGLSTDDVIRTTGASVDVAIPSSRQVATSVNTGVPLAVDTPRSGVVRAVDELVGLVVEGATIEGYDPSAARAARSGVLRRRRSTQAATDGGPVATVEPPAAPAQTPPVTTEAAGPAPRRVVRVVQSGSGEAASEEDLEAPAPPSAPTPAPAPTEDPVSLEVVTDDLSDMPPPQIDDRPVHSNGTSKRRRRAARS